MSRPLLFLVLIAPWGTAASLSADEATSSENVTVAGQELGDYLSQINDADRVVRLRCVRSLGAFGTDAGDALRTCLSHDDAAVRYIAAASLGRIGGKPLTAAKAKLKELAKDERSLAVRLAASYALCCGGLVDQHLPLLIETLDHPERGIVCSTAELIGNIGPSAAAAVEPLEAVYEKHRPGAKGGDYHKGGAAMNALRKLRQ